MALFENNFITGLETPMGWGDHVHNFITIFQRLIIVFKLKIRLTLQFLSLIAMK